jgi:predicted  nucleic acid-binding Zn-ribbon protein
MLGGCPDCGGNKFQFLPESAAAGGDDAGDILEAPPEPVSEAEQPGTGAESPEDLAQATARRAVVAPDELPTVDEQAAILEDIARDSRPPAEPDQDRPDLETLRQELNDQFESIKIVAPGEYELNLMELYDREEYIIALEEDGRYVIDVPTGFGDASEPNL